METAYMMSIRPEWVDMILCGKKLAEVRKSAPFMKPRKSATVYIYETRNGGGRGAVVARFKCPWVHRINCYLDVGLWARWSRMSCLTVEKLREYQGRGQTLAFWEIEDIEALPEPLPVTAFGLKRPPQSWCQVEKIPPKLEKRRSGNEQSGSADNL